VRGVTTATEEFLSELGERFDRIAVACSFQKEAVVIAHLVSEQLPEAKFFTLDTGLFFPETYETWERLEERLGITVEGGFRITLEEQAALHPAPVYSEAAKRRVRASLYAAWPVGLVIGIALMWAVGWRWIEGIGFGVALAVALWYIGLVLLTERDDGRIQRRVREIRTRAE